jgi:hypothetical protein
MENIFCGKRPADYLLHLQTVPISEFLVQLVIARLTALMLALCAGLILGLRVRLIVKLVVKLLVKLLSNFLQPINLSRYDTTSEPRLNLNIFSLIQLSNLFP